MTELIDKLLEEALARYERNSYHPHEVQMRIAVEGVVEKLVGELQQDWWGPCPGAFRTAAEFIENGCVRT